jgi:hypothetical protein
MMKPWPLRQKQAVFGLWEFRQIHYKRLTDTSQVSMFFEFAKHVRRFTKKLKHSILNSEDAKQVIRSSGSVGANYIEANESLSKKDFVEKPRLCFADSV